MAIRTSGALKALVCASPRRVSTSVSPSIPCCGPAGKQDLLITAQLSISFWLKKRIGGNFHRSHSSLHCHDLSLFHHHYSPSYHCSLLLLQLLFPSHSLTIRAEVSVVDVVCGVQPERTNYFLQCLCAAAFQPEDDHGPAGFCGYWSTFEWISMNQWHVSGILGVWA